MLTLRHTLPVRSVFRAFLAVSLLPVVAACMMKVSVTDSGSGQSADSISAIYESQPDIYLLIGQSNMAGRAIYGDEDARPMERVYLLNNEDKWEIARNPLNRYSTVRKHISMQRLSPAYSFAQAMTAAEPSARIGLVVNAKGGSSINQWQDGSYFYQEAVRRTNRAIALGGRLKGIVWHQGETDAADSAYLDKLVKLIRSFREDFADPNLPFVAGQINNVPLINDQIARLPDRMPHTGYASSAELVAVDQWHFDTESVKLLGRRYAEQMLRVQQLINK